MEQANITSVNYITLSNGEIESYCKVIAVTPNSRFSCIYQSNDSEAFKLLDTHYNSLVSISIMGQQYSIFNGLEHYSIESKSFVIYTKNKSEHILVFENGKKWVCKYVGEEYNHFRSMQLLKDEKWIFFDTREQNFHWNPKKAIQFNHNDGLDRMFKHDYYTIFHSDSSDNSVKMYSLHCYRNWTSHSYNIWFQSCYEEDDYIIGKRGDSYYIFTAKYETCHPIYISDTKPHMHGDYYIVHNEMGYSILKQETIRSNYDWQTDSFKFINDNCIIYDNGISLILYDVNASMGTSIIPIALLPLNWMIISLTGSIVQIATPEGMKYLSPQQLLEQGNLYWKKNHIVEKTEPNCESNSINKKNLTQLDVKYESCASISSSDLLTRWEGLELKFPNRIKAFVITDRIYSPHKRAVELKCKISHIVLSDYFLLFSIEDKLLTVIRYEGYKDYKMYYYAKLNDDILTWLSSLQRNQFMPISQNIDFTENNYISIIENNFLRGAIIKEKRGAIIKEKKDEKTNTIKQKENMSKRNLVFNYLKAIGFKQDKIEKAIAVLFDIGDTLTNSSIEEKKKNGEMNESSSNNKE